MTAQSQQATTTSPPWLLALALSTPVIVLPASRLFMLPLSILAILGFFMLIGLLRHRQSYNKEDKVLQVLPRCFLFIWLPMLISSIDANAAERVLNASGLYLGYGFAALAVAVLLRAQAAFKQVAVLSSIVVCLWAFNGVAQFALGVDMFNRPLVDANGYANSFFSNSQQYGFYLGALAAIPLYTLYLMGANRLTHFLVAILLIVGVLVSGARSGWLMLAWALVPYTYLQYVKSAKRPILPMIIVPTFFAAIVCTTVLFSPLVQQQVSRTEWVFAGNSQQIDTMARDYIDLWKVATEISQQHVVNGVGVDNFLTAVMPYLASNAPVPTLIDVTHPHQVLLDIGVSTGMFGLLGLLLIYAAVWRLWCSATPEQQKTALPMLMPMLVLWWPLNIHQGFYSVPLAALTLFFLAFSIAALTYRGEMK